VAVARASVRLTGETGEARAPAGDRTTPGSGQISEEEHLVDGVEPDQNHAEPACQLVARQDPDPGQDLQDSEDEGDPAQVFRLAKTKCALATNTCELAIAAMPYIRLKQPPPIEAWLRTGQARTRGRPPGRSRPPRRAAWLPTSLLPPLSGLADAPAISTMRDARISRLTRCG
jgi:hypothetical protein